MIIYCLFFAFFNSSVNIPIVSGPISNPCHPSGISFELTTFISKFYDKHTIKPKEVIVPTIIDKNLLNELGLYNDEYSIDELTGYKVKINKKMLDLAVVLWYNATTSARLFYAKKRKSNIFLRRIISWNSIYETIVWCPSCFS